MEDEEIELIRVDLMDLRQILDSAKDALVAKEDVRAYELLTEAAVVTNVADDKLRGFQDHD
jgi:hypothetical protein